MTAKVDLCLQGAMDHLRIVWQTGQTLLESIPFRDDPETTRYNVLLAVQEMLTNVLRHGYGGDESAPIVIEFEAEERGMSVVIRDQGPEFDPLLVDTIPEEDELPDAEGGYGILITKMVMDELEYRREGDWNVLRLTKFAKPVTAPVR